jgi:hypothetical protein
VLENQTILSKVAKVARANKGLLDFGSLRLGAFGWGCSFFNGFLGEEAWLAVVPCPSAY